MMGALAAPPEEPGGLSPHILRAIGRGFTPPPVLLVSEWAERYLELPAVSTSRPGRYRHEWAPHARAIMDALSPASPWRRVVFMSSAQIAKTTIGLAWIGYTIDQHPGPLLHVQPTVNTAKRLSRQRIEPMIVATPCLRTKVRPARARDAGNTRLAKEFPNGLLILTGANSPAELAQMPARDVHLDELDRFPTEVGEEGDPVELVAVRQETFDDGKTLMTSTPTVEGLSRIALALQQCDVEMEYQVPCPLCGVRQALVFAQLRWPTGNPAAATYQCSACEGQIPPARKRAMVRAGAWVPVRDNGQTDAIGFRIWQAYSLLGRTSWGQIAAKYEKAKDHPALLRAFTNLVLGLPYAEAHEQPKWRALYDRRESYPEGTVPPGPLVLTAGADVQLDRIEVEVVGWGRGLESWSVTYRVIPGEIAREEVKEALTQLLLTAFPVGWGAQPMPISCFAIDAGYSSTHVYAWARRHRQPAYGPAGAVARGRHVVAAVKGDDAWGQIIKAASTEETGNRRRGVRVYSVAKYQAWRELYDFLRLEPPTDAARAAGQPFAAGSCHFPEYHEDFFKQLVSPQFVIRYDRRGAQKGTWVKDPSLRSEVPDARAYARAAAALVGLERFRERDWEALEREYGVTPVPPPPPALPTSETLAASPPPAPPASAPASTARRYPSRWSGRTRLTGW
jgi:phage terminase large subunit GpA-like protein